MKAVAALLLVLAVAVAQAQNLQYEQAAYTDAAAPLDEAMPVEESFAEVQDEAIPGAFSAAAHAAKKATRAVRQLFNKRKNGGGNISPSKAVNRKWRRSKPRRPRAPVRGEAGFVARAGASASAVKVSAKAEKKALKAAIIDAKAGEKAAKKRASKAVKAAKKAKKAAKKLAKLLGKKGGKKVKKAKRGGKRGGKKGKRFPKAPAAARGFRDNLWHSERFVPKEHARDPEMQKLDLALAAVKEDILSTNKQINDERRWVIAVSKIIKSYNTKMQRVEAHIIALRKEMKMLYRKKKQIENLKLQRALEAKLKEAKAELKTLTESLKHVARKQGELNKSGRSLRSTIAGIQGQLAKLRGQRMFKKCRPGTKYSRKAKKCKSVCGKGKKFSRKSKKCVARCAKGKKWSRKSKKCVVRKAKRNGKAKKARRSRRAARK